ncbi:MAG: DNA methyltransferase [Candidatus Saccharicenans sp.]|nr:DNA methyltransferase [Candidatus Saccharicenans sp.]
MKKIRYLSPPQFRLENTTVWSFRQRGSWATHSGEYRGNYSPNIPRNIILRYSRPADLVLDMFCGAGTTAIEAKLLGRRCIAYDINEKAVELARENLSFQMNPLVFPGDSIKQYFEPELEVRDARDLSALKNNSIDLICTHPPYANIIQYTNNKLADLSFLDIEDFLEEMRKVAAESLRVLKPGRQCALLIGDTRRKKHIIPLGFRLIDVFLEAGFSLRELIIKRQHNCKTTGFWYDKSIKHNFLLLAHEYLPVFEKPLAGGKQPKIYEENVRFRFSQTKIHQERSIMPLETTTVWVFPAEQKEKYLSHNLIQRYSPNDHYLKFKASWGSKCKESKDHSIVKNKYKLIWINSSFLVEDMGSVVRDYLKELKDLVCRFINVLKVDGFIAIEAQDIRLGNKLIPVAKLIVDELKNEGLWLKEIIVVTGENNSNPMKSKESEDNKVSEYLKISHGYILIYEKRAL